MGNSGIRPVVIRCPCYVRCNSSHGTDEIMCEVFGAVKTEVLKADLCPEARSKRHAQETTERFERAEVDIDTHFAVTGEENDVQSEIPPGPRGNDPYGLAD